MHKVFLAANTLQLNALRAYAEAHRDKQAQLLREAASAMKWRERVTDPSVALVLMRDIADLHAEAQMHEDAAELADQTISGARSS